MNISFECNVCKKQSYYEELLKICPSCGFLHYVTIEYIVNNIISLKKEEIELLIEKYGNQEYDSGASNAMY